MHTSQTCTHRTYTHHVYKSHDTHFHTSHTYDVTLPMYHTSHTHAYTGTGSQKATHTARLIIRHASTPQNNVTTAISALKILYNTDPSCRRQTLETYTSTAKNSEKSLMPIQT